VEEHDHHSRRRRGHDNSAAEEVGLLLLQGLARETWIGHGAAADSTAAAGMADVGNKDPHRPVRPLKARAEAGARGKNQQHSGGQPSHHNSLRQHDGRHRHHRDDESAAEAEEAHRDGAASDGAGYDGCMPEAPFPFPSRGLCYHDSSPGRYNRKNAKTKKLMGAGAALLGSLAGPCCRNHSYHV
jgi:hypothetical protein